MGLSGILCSRGKQSRWRTARWEVADRRWCQGAYTTSEREIYWLEKRALYMARREKEGRERQREREGRGAVMQRGDRKRRGDSWCRWRVAICSQWLPYRALRLPLYSPLSLVNSPYPPSLLTLAESPALRSSLRSRSTGHRLSPTLEPINVRATSSARLSARH